MQAIDTLSWFALQDPDLHVKNLKTSHEASPLVNHCIECGFCESACPSKDVTLTPRQRITSLREIHRLREIQDKSPAQLARCAWPCCHRSCVCLQFFWCLQVPALSTCLRQVASHQS